MKRVDFSETIAASDLKIGRCRQLIEFMKVFEYLRSSPFLPYIFLVFYVLCFTRPRYQLSVYRTIGPLVIIYLCDSNLRLVAIIPCISKSFRPLILPQMTSKPFSTAVKHGINAHAKPRLLAQMMNNVNLNIATLLKTLTS